jgi:amidophosphoribosyltransferase
LDSLNVFANALNELGKARANVDDIFTALRDVYKRCIGAYSCVAMVAGFGLLAFRCAAALSYCESL